MGSLQWSIYTREWLSDRGIINRGFGAGGGGGSEGMKGFVHLNLAPILRLL